MTPISVVILTLNEEKNIQRCLDSVLDTGDDILVVDSYSTDKTKMICSRYPVRFIEHQFDGYIEQKNWAITQARYPHVLSLDADEALSDRLKLSIKEVKKNWEYDGYFFNRLTSYCGKWIRHTGWYPDRKLRLWDSRKGRWEGINPHDRYVMGKGSTQHHLKGDLLHFSYHSIDEHISQINNFSTIGAHAAIKKGKRSNLCKVILKPVWKFIRHYIMKLGFLDGYYGFVISVISSHYSFLKYVKMKELGRH